MLLALALAACTSERALWPTPSGGDTTTAGTPGTPGTVQKATLTVTVEPEPTDSSVTRALSWNGVVPGATIVIQRAGSSATLSATSDSAGVSRFTNLLPGEYTISVLRQLQSQEASRLETHDAT